MSQLLKKLVRATYAQQELRRCQRRGGQEYFAEKYMGLTLRDSDRYYLRVLEKAQKGNQQSLLK